MDISEVTRHWVRKTEYMLNKGIAYRLEESHENCFTDIIYEELVTDPLVQLEKIYRRYNGITGSLRASFKKADLENPQGKYGIHEYSLSDFGLNEKELVQRNATYYELYRRLETGRQSSMNDGRQK